MLYRVQNKRIILLSVAKTILATIRNRRNTARDLTAMYRRCVLSPLCTEIVCSYSCVQKLCAFIVMYRSCVLSQLCIEVVCSHSYVQKLCALTSMYRSCVLSQLCIEAVCIHSYVQKCALCTHSYV